MLFKQRRIRAAVGVPSVSTLNSFATPAGIIQGGNALAEDLRAPNDLRALHGEQMAPVNHSPEQQKAAPRAHWGFFGAAFAGF